MLGPFHWLLLFSLTTTLPDRTVELIAREQALAATLQSRDREAMEQLLDDQFVLRSNPDVTRSTWIENAITHCWGDRYEMTGTKTDVQDDVAIVTFELTLHVNPVNCQPATIRSLITDVWVYVDGAWRLRVRHSGPMPAASSGIASQYGLLPQLPPTWIAASELSFVGTGGNASTQTLGLNGSVIHQVPGASTRAQVSFLTSEADNVTRARSIDMQARHGVDVREGLGVFGRVAYTRDRFAGISNRASLDSGLSYTAVDTPLQTLTLEGTGGFTAENHIGAPNLRYALASGSLGYWRKITPLTDVRDDISFTADLMSGSNWRTTNALTFQATLTHLLSLKLAHSFEYRNVPVPGFKRLDTRTSASLVFSFKKIPPPSKTGKS